MTPGLNPDDRLGVRPAFEPAPADAAARIARGRIEQACIGAGAAARIAGRDLPPDPRGHCIRGDVAGRPWPPAVRDLNPS